MCRAGARTHALRGGGQARHAGGSERAQRERERGGGETETEGERRAGTEFWQNRRAPRSGLTKRAHPCLPSSIPLSPFLPPSIPVAPPATRFVHLSHPHSQPGARRSKLAENQGRRAGGPPPRTAARRGPASRSAPTPASLPPSLSPPFSRPPSLSPRQPRGFSVYISATRTLSHPPALAVQPGVPHPPTSQAGIHETLDISATRPPRHSRASSCEPGSKLNNPKVCARQH